MSDDTRLCENCGSDKIRVIDVREKNGLLQRRRLCQACGFKWNTVEIKQKRYAELLNAEGKASEEALKQLRELYLRETGRIA